MPIWFVLQTAHRVQVMSNQLNQPQLDQTMHMSPPSSPPAPLQYAQTPVAPQAMQPMVGVPMVPMVPMGPQYQNGVGTAGGVCGIISLCTGWVPVLGWFSGLVLGILAIALGGVGLKRVSSGVANNKGMAVCGIVCGAVGLIGWVVAFVVIASAFSTAVTMY